MISALVVTAVQRGVVNTRWRDFADAWTLSRHHPVDGSDLQTAIAQGRWAAWRWRNSRDQPPESFALVLDSVIRFADPALARQVEGRDWNPSRATWL